MTKARVSAEGVSLRQPSHSLAGTVVWHEAPAKSGTQRTAIHVANLVIGRVPFAQDFDGSGEQGLALDLSARLIGETVREGEQAESDDDAGDGGSLPGKKEGQHHASPSFLRTVGMVWIA